MRGKGLPQSLSAPRNRVGVRRETLGDAVRQACPCSHCMELRKFPRKIVDDKILHDPIYQSRRSYGSNHSI